MGKLGKSHAGPGLTEKQEQFSRLITAGVSNAEACRIVGINRRTGKRWRHGRTIRNTSGEPVHYPAVCTSSPRRPRHPRYLSVDERTTIADLLRRHKTLRQIAAAALATLRLRAPVLSGPPFVSGSRLCIRVAPQKPG